MESRLQNKIEVDYNGFTVFLYPVNEFNREEYDFTNLEYPECKDASCDSNEFKLESKANNLEQRCALCNKYQKQIPKTSNWNKRRGSGVSRYTVKDITEHHDFDEIRCFFCRRSREEVPPTQEFERDHIKELKNEGGEDRLGNLQILCSACHKLKNHQRLYHNWHLNGRPSKEGSASA